MLKMVAEITNVIWNNIGEGCCRPFTLAMFMKNKT